MKIKRTEHGGYLKEVFHKSSQILVTAGLITLLSGGVILFYCRIFAGAVCNYEPFLIASFPGLLMVSLFMVNSLGVAVFNTLVRKRN